MKKLLCILALLLALVCVFAACGHEHKYGEWSETASATCAEKGEEKRICECGESETREIAALPHTWGDWITTTPASCGTKGIQMRVCVCGESTVREISATGAHVYGEWMVITPATYDTEGEEKRTCACGAFETREIPSIYPAPPVDGGAEDVGDNGGKLDAPEGGGAVSMIYSDEVEIDLSDKKATLLFANPNRSTHNITVELIIQNQTVAQSGLLTVGKRITSLNLAADFDATKFPTGVYAEHAKFVVRFYDPQTNACSFATSEISVTVTVCE